MDMTLRAAGGQDRRVKMLDVAKAAGVSRATVSNVMRGSTSVAEPIRLKVLEEASRLGYVYNRGAASLRMQQSHLIGLIVPDLGNPFIEEAVRGIQNALSRYGYMVVTASTGDVVARQSDMIVTLVEHRIDGFLLIPALGSAPNELGRELAGLPTVLVNRDVQGSGLPFVGPDEVMVGTLAAQHLVQHHRCMEVAYFGGPAAASPRIQRAASFDAMARSFGAHVVPAWSIPTDPSPHAAYDTAMRLIDSTEIPHGVHCHSDSVAFGVLRALRDSSVPIERCRVTAADDTLPAGYYAPRLTSVSVDTFDIGQTSAGKLLLLLDEETDVTTVADPELRVRESCGCTSIP